MRRPLGRLAVLVLAFAALWPVAARAAVPSVSVTSGADSGMSIWRYGDLHDAAAKYEGGYARFDDTSAGRYVNSPHGGYNTTTNKCQVCHAVHRSEASYLLMRGESQADACDYCHVGSAHSSLEVYTADPAGTGTTSGHTIGASPRIPASTTYESIVTTQLASGGTTVTITIRSADRQENRIFRLSRRHGQSAAAEGSRGYLRVGPTALTCLSCHDPHNAVNEIWHPRAFRGGPRLAAGYKLLRASPSGSIQGPDSQPYADVYGSGPATVSYTTDGMRGFQQYNDFNGTGLVDASATVRVPETTLTAEAYGAGRTIWESQAWRSGAETATPTSTIAVDQYALSVWCADCHNLAIGSFDSRLGGAHGGEGSHESSWTHTVPFTGAANGPAQCYTCHRGDLESKPATSSYDGTKAACELCHYGTGSYAVDPVRLSAGGSDWPHSADPAGAYLLGAWTVDASGSVVATTVTAANAGTVVCARCHPASGAPAHAPDGDRRCYTCHGAYAAMDASSTAATSWYHHVLGGAGGAGDSPPSALGGYPSSTTEVYCVSCHGDHDTFSAEKGANLRVSLAGSETTNTDFVASAPFGICLSCHSVSQPKSTRQRTGGSAVTPPIAGADYAQAAHSYAATSTFGASPFRADCSKCHGDGAKATLQTSQTTFGLHLSAEDRILAAFGLVVPISGQTGEALCYGCHAGDTPGPDFYGARLLPANARSVSSAFAETGSSHPIAVSNGLHRTDEDLRTAPRHVECEDCHAPHAARPGVHAPDSSVAGGALYGSFGVAVTSWPAVGTDAAGTWASPSAFSPVRLDGGATAYEAYLCFKCHSGYTTLPAGVVTGSGTYAPTDVAREFNPNNPSYHNVLGGEGMRSAFTVVDSGGVSRSVTWAVPTTGVFLTGYSASSMLTCSSCHTSGDSSARGPHGSSAKWLLDPAFPSDWKAAKLEPASATGVAPGDIICARCHDLYGAASGAGSWGNGAHAVARHQSDGTCNSCHVGIPHGWKRPRLLGYTSDPVDYASTAVQRIAVTSHPLDSGAAVWEKADCQSTCHGGSATVGTYWP